MIQVRQPPVAAQLADADECAREAVEAQFDVAAGAPAGNARIEPARNRAEVRPANADPRAVRDGSHVQAALGRKLRS